jgi:protoporphyrinogen oxidase
VKIGIIGGGLIGLTAAYDLANQGHKVALWEQNPYLGGQASTFELAGTRLEGFYHHIFTSDVDIINLIEEVGLGSEMEWIPSKVGFFYQGRIYNFVTPMDLMRFSPLGLSNRLRLGLTSLYLRQLKDWRKLEQVTAKDWIIRHAGKQNYDVVWGPLLRGKFGERAGDISMTWFWNKIRLRFGSRKGGRERLGYMKGSYGRLIDTLEKRIEQSGATINRSHVINRIKCESGRVTGVELKSTSNVVAQFFPCDAVIATVPAHEFVKLVPEMPRDYASKLTKIRYQAALCLVLMMKRSLSDIYWLNISAPAMPFVAVVEHTNFVDLNRYQGKHIVYVSNYLSADSPLYRADANNLLNEYLPYLRQINPEFNLDWVEQSWLFREEAAQPIVTTDYSQFIPEHKTPIVGLYLANTSQIYPEDRGMNYSVLLGHIVSKLVLGQGT